MITLNRRDLYLNELLEVQTTIHINPPQADKEIGFGKIYLPLVDR